MKTQDALNRFYARCKDRGLSSETIRTYGCRLKYFALENPELPTDRGPVEKFLRARHEPPTRRGKVFSVVQAFYSYLEANENIPSPVPPKGKIGRPRSNIQAQQILHTFTPEATSIPERKLLQGGYTVSSSTSISTQDSINSFIAARQAQGLTARTILHYQLQLKLFADRFTELPFEPEPIEAFLRDLKVANITRWGYWLTLKAMYHFLELRRRFPNPMTAIPRPKVERMVQKTLEISQLRQLLALPLAPRDRAIILLLIDCGPRAGEICSVTRENVKERSIVINGKTGQVEVPISPATHDLLVQLAPSGPLFWGPKGVLNRDGIYKLVRKCLAQIGDTQGKRGPHMLRHTMGRQYMEGGGDLLSLQQILGHTQIDTTAHYGAMSKEGIAARHALATPLKRVLPGVEPLMAHCKKCHKPAMVDGLRLPITRCLHCQVVGQWDIDGAPGSTARSAVADPRPVQAPLTLTSRDLDTELAGRGEAHA